MGDSSNMKTTTFRVRDWSINAVVTGTGPSILFLHGLSASWRWWQPTLEALSHEHRVCAIDLPGSGDSSPLTSLPPTSAYKDLVVRTIDALALGSTTVVGHSLGGYVAVQAALQGAAEISGLFLVAPGGFGPIQNRYFRLLSVPGIGDLLGRSGRAGLPLLLRSLVHNSRAVDDMLCWVDTSPEARQQFLYQLRIGMDALGRTSDEFIIEDAAPLAMPVQLVWGKHDSVFPLDTAYRAQKILAAPPPVIFEGSGHFPQIEEPARFNEVLRSFVSSV